jgi:hypothetical protein
MAAWSRPTTLTKAGATAGFPTVASNGRGVVVVAWYRFVGQAAQVVARLSTDAGRTWGPRQLVGPALLAIDGTRPALLRAAVAPDGTAGLVWQRAVGRRSHEVVAALARPHGRFGSVRVVSARGVLSGYPDIAFDGSGRAVVVWVTLTEVERAVILPGGQVTAQRMIRTGRVPDEPTVAVNRRGDRVYAWIESTASGFDTWVARERAGGRLTGPQRLQHPSAGQLPLADAAIAANGRSTVVYEQVVGEADLIWAASAAWGARFAGGQRLSSPGRFAILGGAGAGSRGVGIDPAGRVSAIWEDNPLPGRTGTSRLRVATSNSAGRFRPARTPQSVSGTQTYERPAIGVAPGGGVVAAWAEVPAGASGTNLVWGSAAAAPGGPFAPPTKLSGPRGDFAAVAATRPGGAGVAVWAQGDKRPIVRLARWSP